MLVHGATYNYEYWDFGRIDGVEYSYARQVAARGIPTFAFDQLGSGSSSRPPSDLLSIQAAAYVAHQIVQGLRSGAIAGVQFGKVITVGHSLGSVVVWAEAISYGDVDGLILTGAAHSLSVQFGQVPSFYPAAGDSEFTGMGLDSGYLTTIPNVRANLFYSAPDDDPEVIASDEARKDLVSGDPFPNGVRRRQPHPLCLLHEHECRCSRMGVAQGGWPRAHPVRWRARVGAGYSPICDQDIPRFATSRGAARRSGTCSGKSLALKGTLR